MFLLQEKKPGTLMSLKSIDINKSIKEAKNILAKEKNISPALLSSIKIILLILQSVISKFKLNSKNSSVPPSKDENRKKP
jgi:transposase